MAYNNLNSIKKINGIPVDLDYFNKVTENDAFFKTELDADENLELLDRDILPTQDIAYSLGVSGKSFKNGFIDFVKSSSLSLAGGSLSSPSLSFNQTSGFALINPNEISHVISGVEYTRFTSSGFLVKAANSNQLKLQYSGAPSATWSIGCDATGFKIKDLTSGSNLSCEMNSTDVIFHKGIKSLDGTELSPGYSFSSDSKTGIYKDATNAAINFSANGSNKLSVRSSAVEILAPSLVVPDGSLSAPSISFSSFSTTGFSCSGSEINLLFSGNLYHRFTDGGSEFSSEGLAQNTTQLFGTNTSIKNIYKKADGTKLVPTALPELNEIFNQSFRGHNGLDYISGAEITIGTEEAYSANGAGTSFVISTVNSGSLDLTEKITIGRTANAKVHLGSSYGLEKLVYDTVGTGQQIDVSDYSKIQIDTALGNISIDGFTGGKEGQMLHLYKKAPLNAFTIVFNSASATQKVLLKGSANYVSSDYGGITLTYDDGIWREISRS